LKSVIFSRRAAADMTKLDKAIRNRVREAIERFASVEEGDFKRLQGAVIPQFRLRVGDWRVVMARPDGQTLLILRVEHRGNVYQ